MATSKKIITKVPCSDWGLTWGLGTTLIGRLQILSPDTFVWRGKSQGRHGQVYRDRIKTEFTYDGENIVYTSGSRTLPTWSETKKSIDMLLLNNVNE